MDLALGYTQDLKVKALDGPQLQIQSSGLSLNPDKSFSKAASYQSCACQGNKALEERYR